MVTMLLHLLHQLQDLKVIIDIHLLMVNSKIVHILLNQLAITLILLSNMAILHLILMLVVVLILHLNHNHNSNHLIPTVPILHNNSNKHLTLIVLTLLLLHNNLLIANSMTVHHPILNNKRMALININNPMVPLHPFLKQNLVVCQVV
ncbi:uncharacterized protein BX663DRAFT_492188 [Cokeromyces recurvatus]|uniref:uncharacterized protein n=1 Tax=Cokeromyces recurvatus TaxID=90255 RepID=UPI002220A662|nr:uncharacterized protein BX663DRAFT_492188 [Cokeromyces recurvatus]KAI7907845.1 hypothetical protein BX663DRAFT_492188 [Cokeromyces recurvatus]